MSLTVMEFIWLYILLSTVFGSIVRAFCDLAIKGSNFVIWKNQDHIERLNFIEGPNDLHRFCPNMGLVKCWIMFCLLVIMAPALQTTVWIDCKKNTIRLD